MLARGRDYSIACATRSGGGTTARGRKSATSTGSSVLSIFPTGGIRESSARPRSPPFSTTSHASATWLPPLRTRRFPLCFSSTGKRSGLFHPLAHIHQELVDGVDADEPQARIFDVEDDVNGERHDAGEAELVHPVVRLFGG